MNHQELLTRLEKRLEVIEKKLDIHLETNAKQDADIQWVKGYIKTSIGFIISLTIAVITTFIRTIRGD